MADNTVDFTNSMLPPDMASDYGAIQRKRAISQAMLQQSMQPQEIKSWTQGLAQLAHAYLGRKGLDQADAATKALGQQYQTGQQTALDQVKAAMAPQPAITLPDGQAGPTRPEIPASRDKVRQALVEAQMSAYPQVRQFGAGQQKFVEQDQEQQNKLDAARMQQQYLLDAHKAAADALIAGKKSEMDYAAQLPRTAQQVAEEKAQRDIAANNNATSISNNRATLAKDYAVSGLNPDGTYRAVNAGQSGTFDPTKVAPEDLAAAYRYKTDGTLPPNMGRGTQGAMEGRRIRSIASALDAQGGESPEDARVRQLAAKGDMGAINKMRAREVAVGANVKNFEFNADQVQQLSGKVDRSGAPIINAWINSGRRSVTGNPDLSAFDTAVKTTVNEFAQIVSGTTAGATTEGEKKKAEALLNAQQTPEQILAVLDQMRIESRNRMKSFADQRISAMPTNVPRAPAPASTGGLPAGWTVVAH